MVPVRIIRRSLILDICIEGDPSDDDKLNVRCENEESRMIPRLLVQGSDRKDLLFTELEEAVKETDLGTLGGVGFMGTRISSLHNLNWRSY